MAIINVTTSIATGTNTDDLIYSIVDPYISGSGLSQFLYGGLGNDTYIIGNIGAPAVAGDTVVELFGEGTDTAVLYTNVNGSYTLTSNVENLISRRLAPDGTSASTAATLNGNELNNIITVEEGALLPFGGGAIETLNGGLGNDTMSAGHGGDTYYVDSAGDVIIESNTASLGGILVNGFVNGVVLAGFVDNVYSTVSYTLGINVENLTLSGNANIDGKGNLLPNAIVGNAGNNVLDGQDGNDTITGGGGNDRMLGGGGNDLLDGTASSTNATMDGGLGDDTYRMDSALDTIIADAGGFDTVQFNNSGSFNSWVLPAFIEKVVTNLSSAVTLTGNALDNQLYGNAGNDTLIGGDGNDILDGGVGSDVLNGGKGNDTYVLDSLSDVIVTEKAAEGIDTVFVTMTVGQTYTLAAQLERLYLTGTANTNGTGNALDNALVGNDTGNNILLGQGGNDNIRGLSGNDTLSGGLGNDILDGGLGNDSLVSDAGNDQLFGGDGNDILDAGAGNDILNGGVGNDSMAGGAGNDIYFVDSLTGTNPQTRDIVYELTGTGGGIDLVNSSVSINELFANVENLTLTGLANIDGIGNALSNIINGNAGDNTLDAGRDTLNDSLVGGLGNDTYIIYGANDAVNEVPNLLVPAPGSGLQPGYTDTVIYRGTTPYTLANNVEQLGLDVGLGNVNATGNTLDNWIVGSSGNNSLDGAAGNDTIYGGDGADTLLGGLGNDRLDGNLGADVMAGGAGDDMYTVESTSDIVNEVLSGGAGNDTVVSFVREINIDPGFNGNMLGTIENVTLGGGALNAIGNGLNNILRGNALANVLTGAAGNDTYYADLTDQIIEGSAAGGGTDTVFLDVGSNGLNVAVNVGSAPSLIPRGQLWNVENVTLLGSGNANLLFQHYQPAGTKFIQANTLTGNDGSNILDGGFGADSMTGGKGGDTYYVDDAGDKTIELADQGSDTVFSTVTWTLAAETEHLNLIGQGVLSGTGNALDNRIRGNDSGNTLTGLAGNDTLAGGSGNDTMNGGDGDDTYYVGQLGDVVQDTTGIDTVVSYISGATIYNLAAPVENLVFSNEFALPPAVMKGNGNALDNRITANLSANAIDGGAGNDTLDFNIVGSLTAADTLSGGLGNDMVANDTLLADITNASLVLTGMSAIETAVLRAEGGFNGSIDFGATGWAGLREVDFTGSLSRTLTVNNAPHTGFVNNAVSGTPLVFGLVDFDGNGVTINGDNTGGTTDVLNLAIRDSGLNATLTTAGWETIRINNQPAADGSFANNTLDMSGLTVSANRTVIEVTGSGGSPLTLTALKPADLTADFPGGPTTFDRSLQVSVVNFDGRLTLQESNATANDVIQVNVRDSSFWLDAGQSGGTSRNFETIEINALGPLAPATVNTSFVHLNEASTLMGGTLGVSGVAGSVLSIDGIRAATINASTFAGNSLFLTAESTAAGTWTGPTSGAVNFVFTGGGGNDIFNFTTAGSVDGMDQVFGGIGTDTVNVDITGMGVTGTAMSGGLHFEDTETINFTNNNGTAVVDASMMDGNVTLAGGGGSATTTIHGLAGNFNGGGVLGNVTIYADPSAGNATYSSFGAGTQILYGSQAQGVATTFTMGGNLDDADFIQGWDFDTVTRDALSATFNGGSFAPQIQGVEDLAFTSSGGANTINAANIVGAVNWTLTGTQALTINGGVGMPINGASGMIINAGGLSGLFTLDASNIAETITLGSGGSLVNAWAGNDSVTGGSGADTMNGGDGDDFLQGGGAADVLNGDAGNDTFRLGQLYAGTDSANDTVDGGAGNIDCLDYDGSTAITVTFTGAYSGSVTGTSLGTDGFANIERIIASQGNDSITGFHGYALDGSFPNYLRNYFGNVGNDTLNGGDNAAGYTDIADYGVPNPAFGVFVNLGTGPVTVKGQTVAAGQATDMTGGSTVGTDTLINIDGAFGSGAADILVGGSDSRAYNGVLFEQWTGGGGNDIIAGNAAALSSTLSAGAPGIVNLLEFDMVFYGPATSGVRVNLFLGTAQDGQGGNDLLFDIDQVQGSSFDDMLIGGNAQNDYFESFEGRQGDDYIDGRSGYDSARYQNAANGINADLSTGIVQDGDGGTDVLLSIEHLRGGAGNDTMKGSAGNDAFEGMAGVDAIDGGAGFDRVEFGNSLNGVEVDLSLGAGQVIDDGWGNVETLIGIEALRGSIHDDSLTGSGLNEFFDGRGGNDTIAGGGGIDGAGYSGAFGAVTVDLNLSVGTATGADGTDDLTGIENIVGSFYSDTLIGDANANRLEGAATKYWTYANTGTTDNDTLTGGAGSDVFVFNSALDAGNNVDEITDFVSGTDKIELDDAIFAGLLAGSGIAGKYAENATGTALAATDLIVLNTLTGDLYYDADGSGGGASIQFATLTGVSTLSAADFIIV